MCLFYRVREKLDVLYDWVLQGGPPGAPEEGGELAYPRGLVGLELPAMMHDQYLGKFWL